MICATVLKSGGVYTPEWVHKLRRQVERFAPGWRFVCLSDTPIDGVEVIPLEYGLHGWWSKMELFRPGALEGRVVFLDLDTLLVRPQTWHEDVPKHGIGALHDVYRGEGYLQSSVLVFTAGSEGCNLIWDRFNEMPERFMRRFSSDQVFMEDVLQGDWWGIQDHTDALCSFKAHARVSKPYSKELVFFHGNPRPNDTAAGWAYHEWDMA